MSRVFLLSPASTGGERAKLLLNPKARFPLALALRAGTATLGEVMSFLSGLYFRGKLTYAAKYARPPAGCPGVLIITTNRGLVPPWEPLSLAGLKALAAGDIDPRDPTYRRPLETSARELATAAGAEAEVVLLGSIATGKYVDLLLDVFGERLTFPAEFVGRGDMSRGGLLLRCAREERELATTPVAGAVRHGPRPPRLPPVRRPPPG